MDLAPLLQEMLDKTYAKQMTPKTAIETAKDELRKQKEEYAKQCRINAFEKMFKHCSKDLVREVFPYADFNKNDSNEILINLPGHKPIRYNVHLDFFNVYAKKKKVGGFIDYLTGTPEECYWGYASYSLVDALIAAELETKG